MKRGLMPLLLISAMVLLFAGVVLLYARFVEPDMLKITKTTVDFPVKAKIAFFSDTHFGKNYSPDYLERIVKKINTEEPDLVIFGGDFIDNYVRDRSIINLEKMQLQLSEIRGLKFAVHGNHDCGGGAENFFDSLMVSGGFRVLSDEDFFIKELHLNLVGYNDYLLNTTPPRKYKVENEYCNIFLCHEPAVAKKIQTNTHGFVLAGHSHGGQVSLPFLTNKILPPGIDHFVKGWYPAEAVNGTTPLFVTSGIGTTFLPLRFGNVPEIVILEIGK